MLIKIVCIFEVYGKISENFYFIKSYLFFIILNMSICFLDVILVNILFLLICVNFLFGLDIFLEYDEFDKNFKL